MVCSQAKHTGPFGPGGSPLLRLPPMRYYPEDLEELLNRREQISMCSDLII